MAYLASRCLIFLALRQMALFSIAGCWRPGSRAVLVPLLMREVMDLNSAPVKVLLRMQSS
jgi:hypothetical protein